MVDNTLTRPLGTLTRTNWPEFVALAAFGSFLLFIFVGLEPFSFRTGVESQITPTGEGDVVRQIIYAITFVVVVGMAFALRGRKALRAFPVSLVVVLLWCLLSVTWAIEPGIALRRFLLTFILVSCVISGVDMLGTTRSLQVLRFVMATVLVVNCVSLLFIPQAVHLPGELESELAGNWRGLHSHKNIAGPIAALSALLFYHFALATRRWRDWILFIAAAVFLYGTQSKTAIGFFVMSIVFSSAYRKMGRTELGRQVFIFLFISVILLAAVMWLAAYDTVAEWFTDPTQFTGRVAIWQKVMAYVQVNPILGAGFGSFWQIGEKSPALAMSSQYEKWIEIVPHSHNGYLEILVTTGAIGLTIAIFAFVLIPIKQILFSPLRYDIELKSLLLALFFCTVFSNLFETIFLNRDLPEWVIFLMVLAILHQMTTRGAIVAKPSPSRKRPWSRKSPPVHS
jgi:exopolysaccharide production protein ExoQ